MEKMTNVKAINYVIENCAEELPRDVYDKLVAIKASFEKKSANRKPAAEKEENIQIKEAILEVLTADGSSITEIKKRNDLLTDLTPQKMSAMLTQLEKEGKVISYLDKKRRYYEIVS